MWRPALANIVAGMAGVQLCAAVSHHSCSTGPQITKTCYIVFLSMPKPLALKQARVLQLFSYIRDINIHQSPDPRIYIQQISPTTCFHVCLHVSIGTIKNKVFFFFHSTLEYPFSFRKIFNNLISLRVQVWLTSHSARGSFRLQRFLNDPLSTTSNNFFF